MRCPQCQREKLEGFERCDCGYEFVVGSPGGQSLASTDLVVKRSKLMPTGMLLTVLAVVAIVGKGILLTMLAVVAPAGNGVVHKPGEGGPLLVLAALLDLTSIILLPTGVSCWIIGALRNRRAKKAPEL